MKVLITGGAGYIGSQCNRYFSEQGIETVVLDNLSFGKVKAVIAGRFVKGDCGDRELIDDLMKTEQFDGILHFAATANIMESLRKPSHFYENNVVKMEILLDTAVKNGIKNFIFSSSAAVYGDVEKIPIEEEDPKNPTNPYGKTKLIGEMMLADYETAYGLRYCAFRYFNAAGASADGMLGESDEMGSRLITSMLRAAINKTQMSVFGGDYQTRDGTCLKDYIHVDDLAEAHYLGFEHLLKCGESGCFNLGSNSGFTVLEMIKSTEAVVGEKISFNIDGRRIGDSPKLIASNQKAKDLLGWNPKKSDIETILRDAYNWELKRAY